MNLPAAAYSRRDILKFATSATLATILPALSAGCGLFKPDLETIAERMIEVLNHPDKAREIGAMYIAKTPGEQQLSFEQLTEDLLTILKLKPDNISEETLTSLDSRISQQVRQDFVDENVVIVDSWMLSRTELLICMLAATYI